MILICYDGSPDAQAATDHVAGLMAGAEATVLTIWEPLLDVTLRNGATSMGMGFAPYAGDPDIDAATEQTALRTATAGAERATATVRGTAAVSPIAPAALRLCELPEHGDLVPLGEDSPNETWNSNSATSWLIAQTALDAESAPASRWGPRTGTPGWDVVAHRQQAQPHPTLPPSRVGSNAWTAPKETPA